MPGERLMGIIEGLFMPYRRVVTVISTTPASTDSSEGTYKTRSRQSPESIYRPRPYSQTKSSQQTPPTPKASPWFPRMCSASSPSSLSSHWQRTLTRHPRPGPHRRRACLHLQCMAKFMSCLTNCLQTTSKLIPANRCIRKCARPKLPPRGPRASHSGKT